MKNVDIEPVAIGSRYFEQGTCHGLKATNGATDDTKFQRKRAKLTKLREMVVKTLN